MTRTARGTFDVKLTPVTVPDAVPARLTLEKQFHGELEGTSKGEMLAVGSGAPGGSGGYVAMEKVTGTLCGHAGSFALQHSGTMRRGTQQLTVSVVPDSGTGGLVGLVGIMTIHIDEDHHSYELRYALK